MAIKLTKSKNEEDPRDTYASFRTELQIDKNDLDNEMVRQPVLYQEISEAHVFAQAERDTAKARLEETDARLADRIRKEWSKTGERFAEARVGDAVLQEEAHKTALGEYSDRVRTAAYLGSLVAAYDQRGKMLRELCSLYNAGYFSRTVAKKGKNDVDAATAAAGREAMRQRREEMGRER